MAFDVEAGMKWIGVVGDLSRFGSAGNESITLGSRLGTSSSMESFSRLSEVE